MKKLLFLAILAVGSGVFLTVDANAQGAATYRAQIPFDFQIAGIQYTAGEYVVGPLSSTSDRSSLAITNVESGKRKLLGLTSLVGYGTNEKARLMFSNVDGHYTLSEIVTPRFAFKANPANRDSSVAKIRSTKAETTSVSLN